MLQKELFDILLMFDRQQIKSMKKSYSCSGCGKQIEQNAIKSHINNCQQYDSYYLHKIKKLGVQDNINQLKFLAEELSMAQAHLQSMISKKLFIQGYDEELQPLQFAEKDNMQNGNLKQNSSLPNFKSDSFNIINPWNQEKKKPSEVMKPSNDKMFGSSEQLKINKMGQSNKKNQDNKMNRMSQSSNKMQEYQMSYGQEQNLQCYESDIIKCPLCQKKFYASYDIDRLQYIEECWHMSCKGCLKKYIEEEFVSMDGFPKCPVKDCSNKIPEHQSKQVLGSKFESLQNKAMRKMTNLNIVQCVKCKSQYQFAPGNPNDAPKKDQTGKPVKSEHAILYAQQRFICPKLDCKTQQCKECHAVPYHLGMNCKQFQSRALMQKCRYCNTPITEKNLNKNSIPALSDICNSSECQQLSKNACIKTLPCSHLCSGVKGEKKCLPCLKQQCSQKEPSLMGQKGDDYCSVCYVQALTASPSIQCGCGHVFHFKCIKKRFQIKWLTPRILFNFCLCPLCKKWIQVPPQNELYNTIKQMKELHERIQKMSTQRLKFQECDKDEKLTNKSSPYYNKPREYAMAIYAYFMCFKCKKPYFGGRKNCAQVMNNAQNVEGFDPKQLVCPQCCDIPIQNCPKHGNDFIEFKCKYCCSIAQWFCWGNTHFCEPCHKRQCNGDYVSKYTKDQLPKCQGPGKCPIGGNHGTNGEQKMLGCAICRNIKQNSKNF